MALKDKLMTLEDFKAVRDVDVASNSAQFTEIKADLGALSDLETESKTDLVSAINEAVSKGSSSDILQILSMFYDKLVTEGSHGYDYYRFIQQALGIQTKTLKVYVGYGLYRPSGVRAYTIGENTKRMITDPIEINSKLPTTVKVIGLESAGLRFGVKPCISANLINDAVSIHYPHDGLSGGDSVFGYTDKTYTMTDSNDDLSLGLLSGFGRIPENTPTQKVRLMFADSEDMNNDLPVSSFDGTVIVNGEPYTLDFVTTAPTLKALVYLGKTLDPNGDGGRIDNVNRAVSDFLPFYGSNTTFTFSGATANNLKYSVRYYYSLNNELHSSPVGWNDQSALWRNDNNQHVAKITLPDGATMIGYCAMIFADKDSDIPIEGITGNIVINNVSYSVEEAQA